MCNLSENIREEGKLEAQIAILKNLMESINCTAEKAMDLMGISKKDRSELLKTVHA